MLRNIRKCTVAKAHRVSGGTNWNATLDELNKFIGLIIARGILRKRSLQLESSWDSFWRCPMINNSLLRNRFKEIMRFLKFDIKSDRRQKYKFCLASSSWNSFIQTCKEGYLPNPYITIDEQFLPCKARCRFILYMPKKPDKFGIKFWMVVKT